MTDPLAGKRTDIAHGKIRRLIYPAATKHDPPRPRPCPVAKGERIQVRKWLTIEIEKVSRKLVRGKPAEWHVTFIRHEADRPQLLRRVPSGLPRKSNETDGLSDVERARRDSHYTTSPRLAIVGEPESVGPDWEDKGTVKREMDRQSARAEREAEQREAAIRRRLTRVTGGLPIEQRLHILREIEQLLAGESQRAA